MYLLHLCKRVVGKAPRVNCTHVYRAYGADPINEMSLRAFRLKARRSELLAPRSRCGDVAADSSSLAAALSKQDMRKQRGAAPNWNTRQMASMREVLSWMQTVLVLASDNVSRFAHSRRNWRFYQLHVNPMVAIGFAKCEISFSLKNLDGDRQQHVFHSHKSEH